MTSPRERTQALCERLTGALGAAAIDTWGRPECGLPELPRVAPTTLAEWRELLAFARTEKLRVAPIGLGSKADWFPPPRGADLLACTRHWSGVEAYEPLDGTLSARSGTTWSTLTATVRTGGHHLSPEVPAPELATLGGVLGAAQSGFDRLRYGPLRHNLLGTKVLLADGALVKSGGNLVKNVTGYDLHRLHCGSRGTLCIILEASLRLHPLPETRRVVRARFGTRDEAHEQALALAALPLNPTSVVVRGEDGAAPAWWLEIVLAGRAETTAWEVQRIRELLPAASQHDEPAQLTRLRDLECAPGRWAELVLSTTRSRLSPALARFDALASAFVPVPRIVLHPLLAMAWIFLPNATLTDGWLERLASGDTQVACRGAYATHTRVPRAAPQMEQLARALDPGGLFARGRFHDDL